MDPIAIYTDVNDFRGYTEGLTADTTMAQLAPSIRTVASDIKAVITKETFEQIAGYGDSDSPEQKDAKALLKTALANGAMFKYQIFSSAKKNGSDASLYKYQHEEIKEHYIEAYSRAMDELLDYLDGTSPADGAQPSGYLASDVYRERQTLPLRNAREFDKYYGIDASSFFYHKVLFLIRNTWNYNVKPQLARAAADDAKAMDLARHILAYRVIAQAVMQFDKTELPRSIRWDFNHEYTKGSDMQSRDKLAAQLLAQVDAWEVSLDTHLKALSGATAIASDQNDESNKFYMM